MKHHTPNTLERQVDDYWQRVTLTPIGTEMMEVESLSGYLQRLAQSMNLPVPSLLMSMPAMDFNSGFKKCSHFYENLRQIDCVPYQLECLSRSTQQPLTVLEQHTFLPLFTALNGRDLMTKNHLSRFYFPTKEECLISDVLRWCPLCLHEHSYYKLAWQLREVLICPTHHRYLKDRCSHCGKPVSLLSAPSYFGHCDHCRFPLSQSPPSHRVATKLVHQRQREIVDDYLRLWSSPFASDDTEGRTLRQDIKERLRTLRMARNLSVSEEKRLTGRKMITLEDTRDWMITLASMRTLLPFYNISVKDFVAIQPTPVPCNKSSPVMLCANPWCSAYDTPARPLKYRKCCRTCGARIVRHSEKRFGLPTRQLLQAIYKFYTDHGLVESMTFLERFKKAGLPTRQMSRVMKRLKKWGLAKGSSTTGWELCHATPLQHRHLPVTPAIAILSAKIDHSQDIQRQGLISLAIDQVFQQKRPVTIPEVARELKITRYVLHGWLWQLSRDQRVALVRRMKMLLQQQKTDHFQQILHRVDQVLETLVNEDETITMCGVFRLLNLLQTYHRSPSTPFYIEIRRRIGIAIRKQSYERRQRIKNEMIKTAEQVWSTGTSLTINLMRSGIGLCFSANQEFFSFYKDLKSIEQGHYPSCPLTGAGDRNSMRDLHTPQLTGLVISIARTTDISTD